MTTERIKKDVVRVAGYGRVSTARQFLHGTSSKDQKSAVQKECKSKGWKLIDFISDDGVSGKTIFDRPAIKKIIELAEAGKIDCLMFTKLDRIGRSLREMLNFWKLMEEDSGLKLHSVDQTAINDPDLGKMFRGIIGVFAEWELDLIRDRMHTGRLIKWQDNKAVIGSPPYGYKREDGKIIVHPEHAPIYKKIVSLYVDEHYCYADVGNWLTDHSIPTALGKKSWSGTAVGQILKNPAYLGKATYNQKDKKGNPKPQEEWVEIAFPPLISQDRWDQIPARIKHNKLKPKKSHHDHKDDFLIKGLFYCGECGGKMQARTRSDRPDYLQYVCPWKYTSEKTLKNSGRKRCGMGSVNAKKVDTEAWNNLVSSITNPWKYVERWLKDIDRDELEINLKRLRTRQRRIQKDLDDSHKDYKSIKSADARKSFLDGIDKGAIELKSIKAEIAGLESELKLYNDKVDRLAEYQKNIETLENSGKFDKIGSYKNSLQPEFEAILWDLPPKEKIRIVEAVISPETGGKIKIQFDRVSDFSNLSKNDEKELAKILKKEKSTSLVFDYKIDINRVETIISSLNKTVLLSKGDIDHHVENSIIETQPARVAKLKA